MVKLPGLELPHVAGMDVAGVVEAAGEESPVPVGARVRGGAELTAVTPITGGVQTTVLITIEVKGGAKPACVIESISRYLT